MLRAHAPYNSKTERGGLNFVDPEISIYSGLGQVKTLSGPSAAARTGQGTERCGHELG